MRRGRAAINVWPGWVDALATLVMVIMFLLMVFMVAQFYLREALSGRESALKRLSGQVSEIADLLSVERQANVDLRANFAQLSAELKATLGERDDLSNRLGQLTVRLEKAETDAWRSDQKLTEANKTIQADRETIEAQVKQVLSLQAARDQLAKQIAEEGKKLSDNETQRGQLSQSLAEAQKNADANKARADQLVAEIAGLQSARDQLAQQLASQAAKLKAAETGSAALQQQLTESARTVEAGRERIDALVKEITGLQALKDKLEKDVKDRDTAAQAAGERTKQLELDLAQSKGALADEKLGGDKAREELALLNRQIAALREQMKQVSAALDVSEAKNKEQEAQVADLGKRLNVALASKVQELARYRSEFFGRLREALGDRSDIRVVGDRFVFQSEVLFDSGSADIGTEGKNQLARLAAQGPDQDHPARGQLDPARRRPHRQQEHRHAPVPLELGAVLRARAGRGALPDHPGNSGGAPGRRRLRRVPAARRARRRDRAPAQPPHRDQVRPALDENRLRSDRSGTRIMLLGGVRAPSVEQGAALGQLVCGTQRLLCDQVLLELYGFGPHVVEGIGAAQDYPPRPRPLVTA